MHKNEQEYITKNEQKLSFISTNISKNYSELVPTCRDMFSLTYN